MVIFSLRRIAGDWSGALRQRLEFYSDPENILFECEACGKSHLKDSGKVCTCGEPFPDSFKAFTCRNQ